MLVLVAQIGLSPAVSFTFGWCRKIQKTDNDNDVEKYNGHDDGDDCADADDNET